jgi:DNA invertase Pin-like site-specific DNA recombinase|tara:strand:+ start:267 stop:764 length:498 start_codon:yes stop_codon:yes gene_type:complete
MKVAIYCRVSTEEQDNNKQETMCREHCRRNEHEIYNIYKDVYSGAKDKRPAFNKLLEDMREYKFEMVIVTKLDRMGRSLQHLLSLFDEFNKKRVKFQAITQNIDTSTSMGRLQMQILGSFAEFERNLISERTKEALKGNKKVGKRGKDKKPRKKRGYYERWQGGV